MFLVLKTHLKNILSLGFTLSLQKEERCFARNYGYVVKNCPKSYHNCSTKGLLTFVFIIQQAVYVHIVISRNFQDGALHMIGTMADILLKKKTYKDKLEQFLVNIVFPEFQSPHGHLRARACWMLHYFAGMKKIRVFFYPRPWHHGLIYIFIFADVKYKNPNVLSQSFNLTIESLLRKNEEVPVKVEAAIALQMMLSSQGR